MDGQGYPMVASHDPQMVAAAQAYAAEAGRTNADYEIQMLYGIRDAEQSRLVSEGVQVRTYIPFGERLVRLLHAAARRAPGQPDVLPPLAGQQELTARTAHYRNSTPWASGS